MLQRKKEMKNNMKLIKKEQAEILKNSDTSSLLEYSIALDEKDLDFCIQRFCPNVEILNYEINFDIIIECFDSTKYDYVIQDHIIKLYGKMNNYSSFLAKFITQVFQKELINDEILFVPSACIANKKNSLLILGDFWQKG